MKTFTFTTEAKGGDGKWSLEEIFKLQQGILAFFHIGLSVALYAASDGNSYAVPVRQIFNRWRSDTPGDGCDSLNSCTILQAEAQISGYTEGTNELGGTFDLVFIVPAFSLISGLHHLFAFVRPDYYLSTSKVANPWRMIDYVSSSSLMLAVNSVLFVSPGSLDTLFLTVAFMACVVPMQRACSSERTTIFVWSTERQLRQSQIQRPIRRTTRPFSLQAESSRASASFSASRTYT